MRGTQLTPAQMEALLRFAADKLGVSEQQLARTVQTGDTSHLGLSPENNRKLEGLMNNNQSLETLLRSPQTAALLERLLGGKD